MCKRNYAASVKRIMPHVPIRRATVLGNLPHNMWNYAAFPRESGLAICGCVDMIKITLRRLLTN